jgi:hypothetical protein
MLGLIAEPIIHIGLTLADNANPITYFEREAGNRLLPNSICLCLSHWLEDGEYSTS